VAYRGRLIFPFLIEIAPLDLAATEAVGYDPEFREPVIVPTLDRIGASARQEATMIRVQGSFHTPQTSFALQQSATGNLNRVDLIVLFHFAELESAGLVEASTGTAKIKVGDRLNAIYNVRDGSLVQKFPNPPGAFVKRAGPLFGLGSTRNLLEVNFQSNDQGMTAGG
jgi:hypothetical protein